MKAKKRRRKPIVKIPRSEIKTSATLPDNTLIGFMVESLEKTATQGGPDSKLPAGVMMYKAQFRITEPAIYEDMVLFDYFVVGTEADPDAEDPTTWTTPKNMGSRRLNQLLGAIGVESDDSDDWPDAASEQVGKAMIGVDTPATGKFAGQPQNRIRNFYAPGDEPQQATGKAATPAKVAGAKPTPAVAKPAVAATPAKAVAPSAVKPVTRVAPTPTPAAAKPATKAAAPVVAKGQQMMPCSMCDDADPDGAPHTVPRAEFRAHIMEHATQETGETAEE